MQFHWPIVIGSSLIRKHSRLQLATLIRLTFLGQRCKCVRKRIHLSLSFTEAGYFVDKQRHYIECKIQTPAASAWDTFVLANKNETLNKRTLAWVQRKVKKHIGYGSAFITVMWIKGTERCSGHNIICVLHTFSMVTVVLCFLQTLLTRSCIRSSGIFIGATIVLLILRWLDVSLQRKLFLRSAPKPLCSGFFIGGCIGVRQPSLSGASGVIVLKYRDFRWTQTTMLFQLWHYFRALVVLCYLSVTINP